MELLKKFSKIKSFLVVDNVVENKDSTNSKKESAIHYFKLKNKYNKENIELIDESTDLFDINENNFLEKIETGEYIIELEI